MKRYMVNGRLVAHDKLPPSVTSAIAAKKKIAAKVIPPIVEVSDDLEKNTVAQLQDKLSAKGIEFSKSAKKGDLIDLLEALTEEESDL